MLSSIRGFLKKTFKPKPFKSVRIFVRTTRVGNWYWNAEARNNRRVCTSGEGFFSKGDAIKAAQCMSDFTGWPVIVIEQVPK